MPTTYRRILITQNQLRYLRGSEVVTLELAEYFLAQGAKVTLYTLDVGGVVADEIEKLHGVEIVSDPNVTLSFRDFDLVWIHHQVVPLSMVHELQAGVNLPLLVFHHMSAYVPLEAPFLGTLEPLLASVSSANSPETKDALQPYFNNGYDRLTVFPNPVGYSFSQATPRMTYQTTPARIAIVSNHPPVELQQAADILRSKGVLVDFVGDQHEVRRITPAYLLRYDCVVSIGKTCQYSLVLGIPVYCYDHFGGPGYLSSDSYEAAEARNFSGRGFTTKTAHDIANELTHDFPAATSFASSMLNHTQEEFSVDHCLDWLLTNRKPRGHVKLTTSQALAVKATQKILCDYVTTVGSYADHMATYERVMDAKVSLQEQFDSLAAQNTTTAEQLHELKSRRSVQLALLLAAISTPRGIARAIHHIAKRMASKIYQPCVRLQTWMIWAVQMGWRTSPLFYAVILGKAHPKHPRLIGLMRIRNESLVLEDTLDHLATIVDGIVIYDDASTDNSVNIARNHPAVLKVIVNKHWRHNRAWEETADRQILLNHGKRYHPTWFFYADADERFEGDIRKYVSGRDSDGVDGIKIQLFDAYITSDDKAPYTAGRQLRNFRKHFGIERRDILMLWRNSPQVKFWHPDAREPSGINQQHIITKFYCQHYGKSLSIQHWEDTCAYYMNSFPKYSDKWRQRIGKAVHTESDFGTPLYAWNDVKKHAKRI